MDLRMRMDVLSASQKQSFSVRCAPSPLNELPEPSKEHKDAWDEGKTDSTYFQKRKPEIVIHTPIHRSSIIDACKLDLFSFSYYLTD